MRPGLAVMDQPWVIRAETLNKVYRLYRRPMYRFLDVFGLCPRGEQYYGEHAALEQVDFTITRGEKVAIIGRNGAGKSTLLKIVAGVLQPSSGSLAVRGSVKALLEIGTGFHPEFNGRDNVLASLGYQGIVGRDARHKLEEIVEFAELEEYIDQPMKTYSTGMQMRLMFATATCTEPDILIADEVLGVGDAYFTHKSLQRIRRLVDARNTTFLLVTHDLEAALGVCERVLWVDRGRVMVDGPGEAAVEAYHHSIKEQEQRRQVRAKVRELGTSVEARLDRDLVVRIKAVGTHRPDQPLYLASLVAVWGNGQRVACEWGAARPGAFRALPSESVQAIVHDGRPCLVLREQGDIFHEMAAWLRIPDTGELPRCLEVEYSFGGSAQLGVYATVAGGEPIAVGSLPQADGQAWVREVIGLEVLSRPAEAVSPEPESRRYGSAEVTIEAVRLKDATGEESTDFQLGGTVQIEIEYTVHVRASAGEMIAAVGIHRGGYLALVGFFSPVFTPKRERDVVVLCIENLRLASGEYVAAVGLMRAEYLDKDIFYTMSPDVLDHLPRAVTFTVTAAGQPPAAWVYAQENRWVLPDAGAVSRPSDVSHELQADGGHPGRSRDPVKQR